MKIEVLSIPDCPNRARALDRVREALSAIKAHAEILEIIIEDNLTAARLKFPGSPTVRVNHRDVDPIPFSPNNAGLRCRLYPGAQNPGVPDRESIVKALREAMREEAQ